MNTIRWQKPKWLPSFLAMPLPEPAQQASRILYIQRNIILPVRLIVAVAVYFYLFNHASQSVTNVSPDPKSVESPWMVVMETLQTYFVFYVFFGLLTSTLLILKQFPPRFVQWVVFAVGMVDGILLAGLTVQTNGFQSPLYWVFLGLILVNAISIPLAVPQIVLNLMLGSFYLGAGLLCINVTESAKNIDRTIYQTPALPPRHPGGNRFVSGDFTDLPSFALRLKKPSNENEVIKYVASRLSPSFIGVLSNYDGRPDPAVQAALVDDLNRILQLPGLYDSNRFANVKLSPETTRLLAERTNEADLARLNRRLLQDALPADVLRKRSVSAFPGSVNDFREIEGVVVENDTEPFILRLIIIWLFTAVCYGVQLLVFRQRVSEEEERKAVARNDELRAAGRLAAEIAHQLKNPLGIMNNAIYSLEKGLQDGRRDPSQQIEIIREEIEKSDKILTQLMGYAQLSEGRVEKLQVAEELDRAISEVFPEGSEYATVVHREYAPNLPILVMQRSHLLVVLTNLMQNAREAMDGRGNLRVSAHYAAGDTLQIEVADDGPGIPPDKVAKIFQAYFSTKQKGTGLGLAIVKHNVELYGGTVSVESGLGKGARFIIVFPPKTFVVAES